MIDSKYFSRKALRPRQAGTETVDEGGHEGHTDLDISSSNLVSNLTNNVEIMDIF